MITRVLFGANVFTVSVLLPHFYATEVFLFLRHFYDKKIVSKSIQPEAILSDIILLVYYDDFSGFFSIT